MASEEIDARGQLVGHDGPPQPVRPRVEDRVEERRADVLVAPDHLAVLLGLDVQALGVIEGVRLARRTFLEELAEQFNERERKAFRELGEEAQGQGIALIHTPAGFAFAPMRGGAVINPEEYEKLPEEERKRIGEQIEALQERLQRIIRQVPQWGRERRERYKELYRGFTTLSVDHLVTELETQYADLPEVAHHLAAVRKDLIESAAELRRHHERVAERYLPADGRAPRDRRRDRASA